DSSINRALHNETAFMIQRRLQHAGVPMVVLPVRINLKAGKLITAVAPGSDVSESIPEAAKA
ncbi:MAG: hypothetical protein ABIP39_11150, partial [Polyangiaceae bacterium]